MPPCRLRWRLRTAGGAAGSMQRLIRLAAHAVRCEDAVVVDVSGDQPKILTITPGLDANNTPLALLRKAVSSGEPASQTAAGASDLFGVCLAVPLIPDAEAAAAATTSPPTCAVAVCSKEKRDAPPAAEDVAALQAIAALMAEALAPPPLQPSPPSSKNGVSGSGGGSSSGDKGNNNTNGNGGQHAALAPSSYAALVAENTLEMISVHDCTPEGRYLYASHACKSLLGYEPSELIGMPASELFHPEERGDLRVRHDEVLDDIATRRKLARNGDSLRLRRKDGTYVHVIISTHLSDCGLVCVTRDDTECHQVCVCVRMCVLCLLPAP